MDRYLVKATCATALRLADFADFQLEASRVRMVDWTGHDQAGPLHLGLFLDVIVQAVTIQEAMALAEAAGNRVVALLSFAMSVAAGPVEAFIAFNYEPARRFRPILQYLQMPTGMRPTRRFRQDVFDPIWERVNQGPPEQRDRILRAIGWYRKAALDRYASDRFVSTWTALEVLNPLLKDKHHLPERQTVRTCPRCEAPVITIPTSAGIRYSLERTGGGLLWRDLNGRRIGFMHGTRPISELMQGIDGPLADGLRATHSSLLDVIGIPEAEWPRFGRGAMSIPRPPRIRVEYGLIGASLLAVPLGPTHPHLRSTRLRIARDPQEGGRRQETVQDSLRMAQYTGKWYGSSIEIEVDRDPDDDTARMNLRVDFEPDH